MRRQDWLPGFLENAQTIADGVMMQELNEEVIYFVGGDNYFSHKKSDFSCRRFVLASLIINGYAKAVEFERAPLCIPHRTLMNWMGDYRRGGSAVFFRSAPPRRPRIMTGDKNAECAQLIADGVHPAEVARRTGILESTLRKAIKRNAIPTLPKREAVEAVLGSSKSQRSQADAKAAEGLGVACTRADERIETAMGLALCATARFEAGHDIPMAGLLVGLPALCANGLLSGLGRYLTLPKGFYSALHILLVLGFMALGRIRRPEGLRHIPPGEFGKVIGLDRVPEVRTLREKISLMAKTGDLAQWMQELCKTWMEDDPAEAGYLYVDGHVRVYNGDLAALPRRYVSRERLCLRGTTDYWVNDAVGRPFFVVSKAVTEGLASALLNDIVPQLLTSVPQQPSEEELDADPLLHRFVMVFDREGSTHSLLSQLWKQRIGALTYRKNVKDTWPEGEFQETEVSLPGGASTRMKLAMRETRLGAGKESIPVTEVRRLTATGHQTAVISTAQRLGNTVIAGRMFTRWCQENFFAYMMQHYDIDGLIEYGQEDIPGTTEVVNPAWREAEKAVRKTLQTERKLQAKLAVLIMGDISDVLKTSESVEAIEAIHEDLESLRAKRKETARKVTISSLPEDERPTQLPPHNKMLSDTVKMIAYRAETAMVGLMRRHLKKEDEARALVRQLFVSSGDIVPNEAENILTIRIHRAATPAHDKAIAALLNDLTQLEFQHPETGAKMIFSLV